MVANNRLTPARKLRYNIGMMSNMSLPRYAQVERADKRFKPPGTTRRFTVSKLWEVHHEIARRVSLGDSNVDIANSLGVSPTMVSYTRNSKPVQDKVEIMRGAMDADTIDLGILINKSAPRALQLLESIIDGNEDGASIALRARVADKHLDRAGYSPVKKMQVASMHLSPDDIEAIKERSRQSAASAGVIEAEIVEE